jgi:hypothetical protein
MLIPKNPELTVERAANGVPIRYCLDAVTEKAMQNQRLLSMAVCPVMVYGAWKLQGPIWLRATIGGAALACIATQYYAYMTVRKAEKF